VHLYGKTVQPVGAVERQPADTVSDRKQYGFKGHDAGFLKRAIFDYGSILNHIRPVGQLLEARAIKNKLIDRSVYLN
jgi:hypothetical protein